MGCRGRPSRAAPRASRAGSAPGQRRAPHSAFLIALFNAVLTADDEARALFGTWKQADQVAGLLTVFHVRSLCFFVHVRVTNGNQGVLGLQLPLHPSGCCRCYLREPPLSVSVEGRWDNGRYCSSLTFVTKLLCLVTV